MMVMAYRLARRLGIVSDFADLRISEWLHAAIRGDVSL